MTINSASLTIRCKSDCLGTSRHLVGQHVEKRRAGFSSSSVQRRSDRAFYARFFMSGRNGRPSGLPVPLGRSANLLSPRHLFSRGSLGSFEPTEAAVKELLNQCEHARQIFKIEQILEDLRPLVTYARAIKDHPDTDMARYMRRHTEQAVWNLVDDLQAETMGWSHVSC